MAKPAIDYGAGGAALLRQDRLINNQGQQIAGPDYFKPQFIQTVSDVKTPPTNNRWLEMVGNSIILPNGSWNITGWCEWNRTATALYSNAILIWADNNGDDTPTTPTATTFDTGRGICARHSFTTFETTNLTLAASSIRKTITDASPTRELFLVPYENGSTATDMRISVGIYAERVAK